MKGLADVFNNSKVLITGHTGFKGSWLALWLYKLGANVYGISNNIPTEPSHFKDAEISELIEDLRLDILKINELENAINNISPDFIFHLAAQPIVKESYVNPLKTWHSNTIGTLNILDILRKLKKSCIVVFITSDKAYDNQEWSWGYRENDRLGGADPYSASKGAAELAISSYFRSYFNDNDSPIRLASARAGNVVGGGDWAIDRIVPDCVRSWSSGKSVILRNPQSTRPWQHVLEPLRGYLILAAYLKINKNINGESYNFGPVSEQNKTVIELVNSLSSYFKFSEIETLFADAKKNESNLLKLNCDKALNDLGWYPILNFAQTIEFTAEWYKNYLEKPASIIEISMNQIDIFTELSRNNN